MPYLNVDEVESALSVAAAAPYASFTQLFAVPNLTWEGRQCHAIKIANGAGPGRPGVYFLGGVHSREWGSPDILINFIEQLEQAYQQGTGITIGSRTFTAADIQDIVNNIDIVVFPQANPDGRHYSMNTEALWRKNRRTQAPNSNSGACVGVDVNRNYDFLWDFPQYFSPTAAIVDSTDPCDYQVYHGPNAFSEPESQNAKWIFDQFPNVGYFIDIHSYGNDILYSWGDDDDQSTDSTMNFRNAAFDGQRGVGGDAYKEYIPAADLATSLSLAGALHDGIQAFRGTDYTVKSAFNLYPTAGTSDDYAYSRNFVDASKSKVISYTLEWGTEFQPPYSEMQNIIQEVTCGLLAFCLWVRNTLKTCQIVLNRNPIGQDEIAARRNQPHGSDGGLPIKDALRVVVDGFSAPELGLTGANSTLAAPPAFTPAAPGLSIAASTTTPNFSDNGDYGSELQRFTFVYDLDFPDLTDPEFNFATPTKTDAMSVTVGGLPASALLTLIKQPDPFLLHGDPAWLSIDLRVFVVRAGETSAFGPTMGADASTAPGFIQGVISALNAPGSSVRGAFDSLPTDESSKLYLQPEDGGGTKVFNFALAKVHYIGLIGAQNVRVFFRLFQAQSTSGTYDFPPGAKYRRAPSNPNGQPIPLAGILGGEYVTIPCFAESRVDTTTRDMGQQTDQPNIQTFTALPDGSEVDLYFGCWLDINQPTKPDGSPNNVLPADVPASMVDGPFTDAANPPLPIQSAIVRALHQCLIAEINFDPAPIPPGVDPSNWDKLAQRNLAWSDAGSAQAVTPFELRPTPADLGQNQKPDELMIDWGALPRGGTAQLYLPAVRAADILGLAAHFYRTRRLAQIDEHTLRCEVGGVSYVPIPEGTKANFAGLLTVEAPAHPHRGETFNVVVRQLTNAYSEPPPPQIASLRTAAAVGLAFSWRRVIGAFQLAIPIHSHAVLLGREERDLSVLRWIGKSIPAASRWRLAFDRYLHQIAGRVSTFGGDPSKIVPSPTGDGRPEPGPKEERRVAHTGKISGLIFDRFGDFEGFILDTEDGDRTFESRERDMKELVERAWRERIRVTVWTERDEPHRPMTIVLHQPPARFDS